MKPYEEKVIAFLKEKGDYEYGFLGYVAERWTAGELMRNPEVYKAVAEEYGSWFVEDIIQTAVEDPDFPFSEELKNMVPEEIWAGIDEFTESDS